MKEDETTDQVDPSSTQSNVEAYTQERSGKPSNTSDIEELTSSRTRAVRTMRKKAVESDF